MARGEAPSSLGDSFGYRDPMKLMQKATLAVPRQRCRLLDSGAVHDTDNQAMMTQSRASYKNRMRRYG